MPNDPILFDDKRRHLRRAAIGSALILAVGLFMAPERVWSNLLVGSFALLSVGLGGTVFIALTYVCGAGWHVAFRRVPEAMAQIVPIAGIVILLMLLPRMREYGWHHHGAGDAGTFWFKELWLNPLFWFLRAVSYVVIWSLLGNWIVRRSRQEDSAPIPGSYMAGNIRLSAAFLAVYAITFSLASVDWIMALEPMWFSTMWGVYHFSGMMFSALATVVILCILLSKPGRPLHGVFSTEHLHDLGKLLIGFSCFWMYIWFSQYMLIWYSNIPEETSYFIIRTHGPWGPVVLATIALNWLIPFFILLPRAAKRSKSVMMKVAVVILIGRWADLYVMVFPPMRESPAFGIWEAATITCVVLTGLYLLDRAFRAADPVPLRDLYVAESLHYHAN